MQSCYEVPLMYEACLFSSHSEVNINLSLLEQSLFLFLQRTKVLMLVIKQRALLWKIIFLLIFVTKIHTHCFWLALILLGVAQVYFCIHVRKIPTNRLSFSLPINVPFIFRCCYLSKILTSSALLFFFMHILPRVQVLPHFLFSFCSTSSSSSVLFPLPGPSYHLQ